MQESGQIGQDGSPSTSRILFNAMLLRGTDSKVANYTKDVQCRRHSQMSKFKNYEPESFGGCMWCDNFAKSCAQHS